MIVAMGSTRFSPITKTRHANVDENSNNCRRRGSTDQLQNKETLAVRRRNNEGFGEKKVVAEKTRKARRELDASIGALPRSKVV